MHPDAVTGMIITRPKTYYSGNVWQEGSLVNLVNEQSFTKLKPAILQFMDLVSPKTCIIQNSRRLKCLIE